MIRNRKVTVLAILAILAALVPAAAAFAGQPPAPTNDVRFSCDVWEWVVFHQATAGNIRHGTSDIKERGKNVDTKKSTLAYDASRGYFWEYTISHGGGQCQKVTRRIRPRRNEEVVRFENCNGLRQQTCTRPLR